jgi:cytoskeletal protein CcmA (bactofilin family)
MPPVEQQSLHVDPAHGQSLIGPTVVLRGELSAGGDLMIIRGEVHGRVTGDTIVIKKGARVQGLVSAGRIRFERGVELGDVVLAGRIARTDGTE